MIVLSESSGRWAGQGRQNYSTIPAGAGAMPATNEGGLDPCRLVRQVKEFGRLTHPRSPGHDPCRLVRQESDRCRRSRQGSETSEAIDHTSKAELSLMSSSSRLLLLAALI